MADQRALTRDARENGEVDRLRAEIANTRLELGHTIDAIQERLSPERLKQEAEGLGSGSNYRKGEADGEKRR